MVYGPLGLPEEIMRVKVYTKSIYSVFLKIKVPAPGFVKA
jgi:hypothetical protein